MRAAAWIGEDERLCQVCSACPAIRKILTRSSGGRDWMVAMKGEWVESRGAERWDSAGEGGDWSKAAVSGLPRTPTSDQTCLQLGVTELSSSKSERWPTRRREKKERPPRRRQRRRSFFSSVLRLSNPPTAESA